MLYAILAAIILVADQWVKYWTTIKIVLDTGEAPLIPGVVKLVNVHNSGAAFGFLSSSESARWIFVAVAIIFTLLMIVVMAKRVFPSKFANFCLTLAVAGALGNCIDRFVFGYVVDMFKVEFINFAVFNVADIFLVIACILFIFYLLFGYNGKEVVEVDEKPAKEKKARKNKKAKKAVKEKEEKPEIEKKSKKKGFDFEETEPLDDDLFLSQIDSAFEAEESSKPITNEPEADPNIDITPEDIMFGIKGLDIDETPIEEPVPVKAEPVAAKPERRPVNEDKMDSAEDISSIINNAFFDELENKPAKKMPAKVEVKPEEVPVPVKEPVPEAVPVQEAPEIPAPEAPKAPVQKDDPFDFDLESILEEFK